MPKDPFEKLVKRVSDHYESDIILYIGPIERPYDDFFIKRVSDFREKQETKLSNVILILTTLGGDPHAAYRMARCLQEQYETVATEGLGPPSQTKAKGKFRLFVDSRCKSAGTILAAGANILVMSEYGELGPIDVQVRKGDEIGERSSVLTPKHSMESLQTLALHHFEYMFRNLRFADELSFTTKLAAEIAKGMPVGLFEPIYAQIDPMRVGEYDRAMRIASEYGTRLEKSNLKESALEKLVTGYPAHGFVIDKRETKELFNEVEEPTKELVRLGEVTRHWWNDEYLNADSPIILFLTTPDVLTDEEVQPNAPTPIPDAANPGGNAEPETPASGGQGPA